MTKLITTLLFLTFSLQAQASRLQIIHLNDLHSYFAGHLDGRGGYSKVKTKIDELKQQAAQQGIPSIVLDGGDWGEGTSFYMTNDGANSFRALGLLGVDVTVIGNHDHMQGGAALADQIITAGVSTKILSANLIQTPSMGLKDLVTGSTVLDVNGSKIHIIGLSTAEPHFQAPLLPGFIIPPDVVVHPLAAKAKSDGADLVVALTHIGTDYDKFIAKHSSNIDVIIGGHSHTRLEEVVYQQSKNGYNVPIVQTGAHGYAVGSLVIDYGEGEKPSVVSYELHDITPVVPKDQAVESFVQGTMVERNNLFNGRWDEVVGFTEIELSGYKEGHAPHVASCWGAHLAQMTKEAAGSDIGIYLSAFTGLNIEPGPVTFGNLVDNFPHFSKFGDQGWEISTFTMKGKFLRLVLRAILAIDQKVGVNARGFSYKAFTWPDYVPWLGGKSFTYKYRIAEEKIKRNKWYTVAMPSEIGFVLEKLISKYAAKIFPNLTPSGKFYWLEMEDYVRDNSPIRCFSTPGS